MELRQYLLHILTSETDQVHQSPAKAVRGESNSSRASLELGNYAIEGEQAGDGVQEEGVDTSRLLPEGGAAVMLASYAIYVVIE